MRRLLGLCVLSLLVMTTGCGDGSAVPPGGGGPRAPGGWAASPDAEPDPLAGRTFLSTSVREDGADRPLVAGTRIRLSFTDDGRLMAQAGCNSMGGAATVEGGTLVVSDLATTEMGCDPPRHEQDGWLATLLTSRPAVAVDGDTVRLTSGTTVVELVDRRVAEPDRPLRGTTWVLDGIVTGGAVSSVPAGARATVTFDDATVAWRVEGCNSGSGAAAVDERARTVTIRDVVATKIGCDAPRSDVERALTEVLDGTVTYDIEASTLRLDHPSGRGLTLLGGPPRP